MVDFAIGVLGAFFKPAPQLCLTKTGSGSVHLNTDIRVAVGGVLRKYTSGSPITMPILTAGTDYAIYACADGTLRASANFTAPDGYTTLNSRHFGGFHYAAGGNATGTTGGNTTPAINEYSLWDLKWRPACPDPRGMALVAGNFWCDIYMLGVNHHADGTSRNNVTIADGSSPPKVPSSFGGNGSDVYSNFTWFNASEVMKSHGKSLLDYAEFAAATYGATENQSRGDDPVTTGLGTTNSGLSNTDEEQTSKWGIIQATGCLLAWGRDLQYYAAGADFAALIAFAYKNQTGSRGQIYAQNTSGISAARFGGYWDSGANSGSRASYWSGAPWNSTSSIGARGRSDHLCHG